MAAATTVLGRVPAEQLGAALMHEHLLHALGRRSAPPPDAPLRDVPVSSATAAAVAANPFASVDDTVFEDLEEVAGELDAARAAGVGVVVDMTVDDLGRDPEGLQELARSTGVHVVASTGHYVQPLHPPALANEPVEAIAERMLGDLLDAIPGTSVRAGTIKAGASNPLQPAERRVLEAAARAQAATGAAITVHLSNLGAPSSNGHEVTSVLERAGADPRRIVLAHLDLTLAADAASVEDHVALARRGPLVGYDTCGHEGPIDLPAGERVAYPTDRDRAAGIARLVDAGLGDRVVISGDICTKVRWRRFGGTGYAHPLEGFRLLLEEAGIPVSAIDRIFVETPREVLSTG